MKFNSARIKIITVCYILILAAIIFIANRKSTAYLLHFVANIPFGDKLGHFVLMGIFSFLLNLALSAKTIQIWKLKYLLGSLVVFLIVTGEEISQIFVRDRTFAFSDLVADTLGIIIFGEVARFLVNRKELSSLLKEP